MRACEDAMALRRFQKDDRVAHARFGPGVIIDSNERHTLIAFDHAGLRKFATAIVELERSDLPRPLAAPATRRRRTARSRSTVAEEAPGAEAIGREGRPRARQDLPKPERPA